MISQIANNYNSSQIGQYREPDVTYRVNEKSIDGKLDKIEAIKQAIFHILSTERYSNPIYDDNYGVELEQYIGKDIGIITADIETTLNEALTQDDRIQNVSVTSIEVAKDFCVVKFTVSTIYGDIKEEKNVLF